MSTHRLSDPFRPSRALRRDLPVALVAFAAFLATPAAALLYVMPTDETMVARSSVIVFGEVRAAEPGPVDGPLATDFMVQVEEVLKGFVPGGTIVVRQPGGSGADGIAARVIGLPRLAEGDRVLLFLDAVEGVYRTVELALGMFFEVRAGDRTLLLREPGLQASGLNAASPLGGGGAPEDDAHEPRDARRFRQWIADRAAGGERPADYLAAGLPIAPAAMLAAFRPVGGGDACEAPGILLRWREFDRGANVGFAVETPGQAGLPNGGGAQLLAALRAWNDDPGSRVRFVRREFPPQDDDEFTFARNGRNSIGFEDPRDEIAGSLDPRAGGVVALTWAYFRCGAAHPPHVVPGSGGARAWELVETNIATQDGYGNWLRSTPDPRRTHEMVMAHELGHALGMGHACAADAGAPCGDPNRDALMRAGARRDGPGAALDRSERDVVRALYAEVGPLAPRGPEAPTDLAVTAISQHELELSWLDRSGDEAAFDVYERLIDSDFERIATLPANSTSLVIQNVPEASYRAYQVVARNHLGSSLPTAEAGATTLAEVFDCAEDDRTLCLNEGRFRVAVAWQTPSRTERAARAEPLSDDTGDFRFLADEVEIVVKVLDGCAVNQRYWVYAGGVTDVELKMTVIDADTGIAATYYNPAGAVFRPVQDTSTFAVCPQGGNLYGESEYLLPAEELESLRGGRSRWTANDASDRERPSRGWPTPDAVGDCQADDRTLCLEQGRFTLRARWAAGDRTGEAHLRPLDADTGLYWFFDPGNLEMLVRVVDGCEVNGYRWVFVAGLTDVGFELEVADRDTGERRTYGHAGGGLFEPVRDTGAFSCRSSYAAGR